MCRECVLWQTLWLDGSDGFRSWEPGAIDFFDKEHQLRQKCGDRVVLRAVHFYQENARVPKQVATLEQGDFDTFLKLIKEGGYSSYIR